MKINLLVFAMADQRPSVAHHYHQRTKYHPETLAQTAKPLDWESQPSVFKEYKVGAAYSLKQFMAGPFSSGPTLIDPAAIAPDPKYAHQWKRLSRLLLFSYGLTAKLLTTARTPVYFRAVPSAGGLYPAEIYLISRGTPYLAPGLYHYQVATHSLIHFWDNPVWSELKRACFWHPALENTHLALVTTAIFFRSAWRYQARGYRRICLDTGHLLGNIELACAANDYRPHLISGFCDQALNELLYLDDTQEGAIALLPLADLLEVQQNLPLYPTAAASERDTKYGAIADEELLPYLHRASQITLSQDLNWRTITRYTRATEVLPIPDKEDATDAPDEKNDGAISANNNNENDEKGKDITDSEAANRPPEFISGDKYNFSFCYKVSVASGPIDWGQNLHELEQTILKRRSTREYTGETISLNQLKAVLDFTYHPQHYGDQGINPSPDYCDLSLLETFIAVAGVTGLDEGCYYYAPLAEELRQIRFKNFRKDLHGLCLGQPLGKDAAAVIFHTADLTKAVERYGDRAYRYLHMDAGHLGQRINLAAIRLGLGVSGIGGFFDNMVNEVLGIPVDEAVIYITTLGRPA